jgi:hypothetical protein
MTIPRGRPTATWAQLTCTSADAPDSGTPGGWGVKETSPGLSRDLVRRMMSGVSARLDGVPGLSKFPSDRELEGRSRRLAYCLVDGHVTLWHSVEAGNDASGRRGNVFVHAVSEALKATATRPIDYWRSEDWLVPFGVQEVASARIPESIGRGAGATIRAFLDFLLTGEVPRVFVLPWLLAAVEEAVRTSTSAVIITDSPDEAAGWLAAFSYLTAPQLAQRISFVTFERADNVHSAMEQGLHLICVPRVDAGRLAELDGNFLVLDPRADLDERKAAHTGVWTLTSGHTVPVTQWQTWVLDLASLDQDRSHATDVLAAMDVVGAQLPAGAAVPMHWPLAVAMMLDERSVIMSREVRIEEILAVTPTELLDLPVCTLLLDELVSAVAPDRWQEFLEAHIDKAGLCEFVTARRLGVALERSSPSELTMGFASASLTSRSRTGLREIALAAALRAVDLSVGEPDDVLEAARIVTLLLDFELRPLPENDAGVPVLEPVIDRLRESLAAPEWLERRGDLGGLHRLLTGQQARGGPAEIPTAPINERVGPSPVLQPVEHQVVHPESEQALRDEICRNLARLFREKPAGSVESVAIAEAVYVAAGQRRDWVPAVDDLARHPFLAQAYANLVAAADQTSRFLSDNQEQIRLLVSDRVALSDQPGLLDAVGTALSRMSDLDVTWAAWMSPRRS